VILSLVNKEDGREFMIEVEVNLSSSAYEEFEQAVMEEFRRNDIRDLNIEQLMLNPPRGLERVTDDLQQAMIAWEESYAVAYPDEAILTGWWDFYEGDFSKEIDEPIIDNVIKKSKTVSDLEYQLSEDYLVELLGDVYFDDFEFFVKEAIKKIKRKKRA